MLKEQASRHAVPARASAPYTTSHGGVEISQVGDNDLDDQRFLDSSPRGQKLQVQSGYVVDVQEDDQSEDDRIYNTRMPSSTRRYRPGTTYQADVQTRLRPAGAPARSTTGPQQSRLPVVQNINTNAPTPARMNPVLIFALGLFATLVLVLILTNVLAWWNGLQDDWHYGRPRVERVTSVVGHQDSMINPTLFIAINADQHAQVIECPGGDCGQAKVYLAPLLISDEATLTPVTLTFKDVNGDGLPDLIVHVGNQSSVFLNDHKAFRLATDKDNIHL